MRFRWNTRSCRADLIEYFFDARFYVRSRPGQKPVPHPVFENASIGYYGDCQPRHLNQRLRRPERRRQLLACLREELLPLLEALASRHVTKNHGVDDVIAVMDLGNCSFGRKLCAAFSDGGYLAPLTHSASLHSRAA